MKVDELRSTLQEYAADLAHDAPHPRVVAVRGRVQAVRRRRRAAGVAGLAAAVVAAAAVAVPTLVAHHEPRPAGTAPGALAGRLVPRTQTAAGFTYDYVRGVESRPGQRRLRLTVPVGDTPKLVMWASSDTTAKPAVRLVEKDREDTPELSTAGDFDRYVYLEPTGQPDRLTLSQRSAGPHTRLALAVYHLSSTPPPGVSNGAITFRRQLLDSRLLAARIGAAGQRSVAVDVTVPAGGLTVSDTCSGRRAHYWVRVSGHFFGDGWCDRSPSFDPAASSASTFDQNPFADWGIRVGQVAHLRIYTKGAADPSTVLGLGVYANQARTHLVAGQRIPVASEHDGHELIATGWHESQAGSRVLRVRLAPSDQVRAITGVVTGASRKASIWYVSLLGRQPDGGLERHQSYGGAGSGYSTDDVVQPGESPTVVLRLDRGVTPRTRLGIVVSDQVH